MTSNESKTLQVGDKINMVVTGGSGRTYFGEITDANDEGLTIKWSDGEIGFIAHEHAEYLQRAEAVTV